MRLTCPNCDAQYEVPDDVIPQDGRDVQCSNCGNTWFQAHPDQVIAASEETPVSELEPEWEPEVSEDEPLYDIQEDEVEDEPEVEEPGPTKVSANAPDEVLAAAVKAALMRAKPRQDEEIEDAEEVEPEESAADEQSFEEDLDASLDAIEAEADQVEEAVEDAFDSDELGDDEAQDDVAEDIEDSVYYEPSDDEPEADPEPQEPPQEPKRRTIDPTVANILQEEAALEAERRADESSLESQPDLGLDEAQDDAAKRARQARERMARMRGLPPEDIDKPVEPIPANSRRDLLPDIEEINSTLRATEDRAPDEQPDGRPTANQRRAGGSRIGFALAFLLIGLFAFIYNKPDTFSSAIPGSENYVAGAVNTIDNGRIWLDSQMTKLMLWLDGFSSE